MEIVFEILFEIIVEGSLGAVTEKKVPILLRIAAGVFLVGVFGGLSVFLIVCGIRDRDWLLAAAGAALGVFFAFGIGKVIKKRRSGENKDETVPEEEHCEK